jgi:hypothetical protein
MVTSTRAALENWLTDATALLSEQRERSISPSLYDGYWDDESYRRTTTMSEVAACLEDLLGQLTASPGRWILVIKGAQVPIRYLQFLSYEDGSLVCEVTSNYFLDACNDRLHSWNEVQNEKLASVGWEPPEPPDRPNWIGVWPDYSPPVDVVVARALRTLREVFGLTEDDDAVVLKLFSSPRRGRTPASEVLDQ